MTLLKHDQEHLTEPNPELTRQVRASHSGMAHFAGTGPRGLTCRECIHWDHWKGDYYGPNNKTAPGGIKPARCKKYQQLMRGEKGKPVPDYAEACKHFEFNPNSPTRKSR